MTSKAATGEQCLFIVHGDGQLPMHDCVNLLSIGDSTSWRRIAAAASVWMDLRTLHVRAGNDQSTDDDREWITRIRQQGQVRSAAVESP